MPVFESSFVARAPLAEVWDFHADPAALARITPRPVRVVVDACDRPVRAGSAILLSLYIGPFHITWDSVIAEHAPMQQFVDEQMPGRGPFARWRHTHQFRAVDGGTRIADRVEYELPGGRLGRLAGRLAGGLAMRFLFRARQAATKRWLDGRPARPLP